MGNKEQEQLKQQLSQTKQEFDNFRRRTREDLAKAESKGRDEAALLLLDLVDDCDRALEFMVADSEQQKTQDGVKQLRDRALRRFYGIGLEPFGEVGEHFDPRLHNAISTETGEGEDGMIVRVHRRGWRHLENETETAVVRIAMVTVLQTPESTPATASGADVVDIDAPRHRRRRPSSPVPENYTCPYGNPDCVGDCPDCQFHSTLQGVGSQ